MENNHNGTKQKRVYKFAEILPDNERVRKKKEVEEYEKLEREKYEIEQTKRKNEEINLEELSKKQKIDKEIKQKQMMENEKLNVQERISKLESMEGNLASILKNIVNNISPYELTFAGVELDNWNFTSLMVFLSKNESLLTLNLSRKNLNDDHAKEILEMLKKNKTLRRLELEGNFFGPEAIRYFAEAIKVNKTLRYLDLENNNLTNKGEDDSGIAALFDSLENNTMLISLNLSNNFLTNNCGNFINSSLRKNKTLIHLEVFDNQRYEEWDKENSKYSSRGENDSKFIRQGLLINQISELNDAITRNKRLYDEMRLAEWKERKHMLSEMDDIKDYDNVVSAAKIEEVDSLDNKKRIEKFYVEKYLEQLNGLENKFLKGIDDFFAETKVRLEKKLRRGGNKPKKKN